jgi:hypothetical protein
MLEPTVGDRCTIYHHSSVSFRYIAEHVPPMQAPGLAEYPDFIALVLLIVTTLIVALGVKVSRRTNLVSRVGYRASAERPPGSH